MSNRRQKGQDLIEYALLLALVVAVGIYVYVHGGLTDSLKQIYGSASSGHYQWRTWWGGSGG